jgi:hypothetical protein
VTLNPLKHLGFLLCPITKGVILIDPLAFEPKATVILTFDCFMPFLSLDEIVFVGNA